MGGGGGRHAVQGLEVIDGCCGSHFAEVFIRLNGSVQVIG